MSKSFNISHVNKTVLKSILTACIGTFKSPNNVCYVVNRKGVEYLRVTRLKDGCFIIRDKAQREVLPAMLSYRAFELGLNSVSDFFSKRVKVTTIKDLV